MTTTYTSTNNLGLVITGLTEADVGNYTCTATYSNSEYLVQSVAVDSFCKYIVVYRFNGFHMFTVIYMLYRYTILLICDKLKIHKLHNSIICNNNAIRMDIKTIFKMYIIILKSE